MGLDIVEIVVDIEKEFGVEIPNSEAPHLLRLEDMKKFIVHEIRKRGDKTLAIEDLQTPRAGDAFDLRTRNPMPPLLQAFAVPIQLPRSLGARAAAGLRLRKLSLEHTHTRNP